MKLVISIVLILLGFLIEFASKKTNSITYVQEKPEISPYIPECFAGLCPTYKSEETDGDGLAESVVEVPTAMTKGAGKILIIDDGKLVFDSGEAPGISYEVPEDIAGINISFAKEYDETGINVKTWATEEYRYENGKYVLKNTVYNDRD